MASLISPARAELLRQKPLIATYINDISHYKLAYTPASRGMDRVNNVYEFKAALLSLIDTDNTVRI